MTARAELPPGPKRNESVDLEIGDGVSFDLWGAIVWHLIRRENDSVDAIIDPREKARNSC